jgi:serine O-acetyltransferase
MIQSLDKNSLTRLVARQLFNLLPDLEINEERLHPYTQKALDRTMYCFSKVKNKYFFDGNQTLFNHLHTDQYAMFLYYLSNTIWREENDAALAGRVYFLNRAMHALDVFYEVHLPDVFLLVHPVGTVLGRGQYHDYFVAYQRVTVGGNNDFKYPIIGKGVVMYGGSALIGNCSTGENCLISAGTIVREREIPDDVVVFEKNSDIVFKKTRRSVMERYFRC